MGSFLGVLQETTALLVTVKDLGTICFKLALYPLPSVGLLLLLCCETVRLWRLMDFWNWQVNPMNLDYLTIFLLELNWIPCAIGKHHKGFGLKVSHQRNLMESCYSSQTMEIIVYSWGELFLQMDWCWSGALPFIVATQPTFIIALQMSWAQLFKGWIILSIG